MNDGGRLSAVWMKIKIIWNGFNQFFQLSAAILQFITAAAIVSSIVALIKNYWTLLIVFLSITFFVILFVILAYKAFVSSTSLRVDIYWQEAKYTYTVNQNGEDYEQIVEIVVQSLRDGIDDFTNKYWWTGTGEQNLFLLSAGHYLEMAPIQREGWRYYRINFGRSLLAGETEKVMVRQTLRDTGKTHEPILSKCVTEPIGKLTLEICLPQTMKPQKVILYEHATAFVLHPVSSRIVPLEQVINGKFSWEIKHPKFGHTYTIRWEC